MRALKGQALLRASQTSEIALSGSRRLRSTLAAAPDLFAHAVVTVAKTVHPQPLHDTCCVRRNANRLLLRYLQAVTVLLPAPSTARHSVHEPIRRDASNTVVALISNEYVAVLIHINARTVQAHAENLRIWVQSQPQAMQTRAKKQLVLIFEDQKL